MQTGSFDAAPSIRGLFVSAPGGVVFLFLRWRLQKVSFQTYHFLPSSQVTPMPIDGEHYMYCTLYVLFVAQQLLLKVKLPTF